MKRKKLAFFLLLLCSTTSQFGQIPKGTYMIGGDADIPFQLQMKDEMRMYIKPSMGYFVVDNFSLGLNIGSELFFSQGDNLTFSFGLGPQLRYYLGKEKIKAFGHISYMASIVTGNFFRPNEFESSFQPGMGVCYMIAPTVGIEALLNYSIIDSKYDHHKYHSFGALHIGFQIFLPPTIDKQ